MDKLVRLSVFCILLGRGYQHIFWEGPYRAFFWDQDLLNPIFSFMGWSWSQYVTSPATDLGIVLFTKLIGITFIVCALSMTKYFRSSVSVPLLRLSSVLLLIMALLKFKDRSYQIPMLIEHSLQVGLPFVLSFHFWKPSWGQSWIQALKVLVSLTFVGHGAYALGLGVPVPGHFIEMTMEILRVSEAEAYSFLSLAGLWDLAISILIFVPLAQNKILIFATFWGLTTAIARVVCYVSFANFFVDAHGWLYESVFRICHGLVPLSIGLALGEFKLPQLKWWHPIEKDTL